MIKYFTLIVLLYVGLTPKLHAGWKDNDNPAGFIVRNLEAPSVDGSLDSSDSQKKRIAQDWLYVQALARQLDSMNEVMFKATLGRSDERIKSAALLVAHKYKTKYLEDIIERINDEDLLVSQCARHSLVMISGQYCGKNKHVDFGPLPNHSRTTKDSIALLWKIWFEEAEKEAKKSKGNEDEIIFRKREIFNPKD